MFLLFQCSNSDVLSFEHDVTNVYNQKIFGKLNCLMATTKGFNAGGFIPKRGLLAGDVGQDLIIRCGLVVRCFNSEHDQSFLNYAVGMLRVTNVMFTELDMDYAVK